MEVPHGVAELLRELIAIPSVNPEGNPGTSHTGEAVLAAELRGLLKKWGADVELREVLPGRPNLFAHWKAPPIPKSGRRPVRLALAPHLDTVSVTGMTMPPFDPVEKRGRIYGRGASDTKGPMAAMLWAVHEWTKRPKRERTGLDILFAGLMGEEHGNEGAIAWKKQGIQADLILVGEPTGMKVVHAHKGALWFSLSTKGVACHSSTPEAGKNAIYAMAQVLRQIEKNMIPSINRYRHEELGRATMSVGMISGGQKVNIVPDHAEIECDIRSVPGLDEKKLRHIVEATFAGMDTPPEMHFSRANPALNVPKDHPLVELVAGTVNGFDTAPWFCDAGIACSKHSPAVAIGPGSIAQAHTKDEYIRRSELIEGSEGFLRIFEKLAACAWS